MHAASAREEMSVQRIEIEDLSDIDVLDDLSAGICNFYCCCCFCCV